MTMNDEMMIRELDTDSVDVIAGGVLPVAWAIAAVFTGAFSGGVGFGYMVGKDRANRNNSVRP